MEDSTAAAPLQSTPMLWLMGMALAWLAAHVSLGFTREARREDGVGRLWRLAAATCALGTGIWAAMALSIASQALAYPVGFRALALAAAWGVALLAAALPVTLMAWRPSLPAALVCGVWFGCGAALAQAAMLLAAGLLPGLVWRLPPLALGVVMSAGLAAWATWMSHLGPGRTGTHRRRWRLLAAALLAAGLGIGQEMTLSAGDMATQIASRHLQEVSKTWTTLLAALAASTLLTVLAAALHIGRTPVLPTDSQGRPMERRRRRRRSLWQRLVG